MINKTWDAAMALVEQLEQQRFTVIIKTDFVHILNPRFGVLMPIIKGERDKLTVLFDTLEHIMAKLNAPLTVFYLMKKHPELSYSEADALLEFATDRKFSTENSYNNSEIIYPMWKEKCNNQS